MATKTIILVRHGQYILKDDNQIEKLTDLGREQAHYVGDRLKENFLIDRIIHSTMPRAIETAAIIRKQLGHLGEYEASEQVRECVPGFPKKLRKKYGFTNDESLLESEAYAEKAFKKYFKSPKRNSLEVIVCHGNLIRFLICRVLGIDTLNWRNLDIQQCGISVVELRSTGDQRKVLISHNDVGHIPKAKRTFL